MGKHVSGRRIVAGGLACVAAGATTLVLGAIPASAHGNQEPEPAPSGMDCLSLAEEFGIDQEWQSLVVDDVDTEAELFENTYDLGNGESVSISVENGKYVEWESTIGIDAVYVEGEMDEYGSYFYIYAATADDEEATSDYNLGTPPWEHEQKNKIESIEFCYDTETEPTVPTTPTTAPPEPTVPPSEPTTPSSEAPTTAPPSSVAPSTTTTTPTLPETGSNSTMPMVIAGLGLVAVGAGAFGVSRKLRGGNTPA